LQNVAGSENVETSNIDYVDSDCDAVFL